MQGHHAALRRGGRSREARAAERETGEPCRSESACRLDAAGLLDGEALVLVAGPLDAGHGHDDQHQDVVVAPERGHGPAVVAEGRRELGAVGETDRLEPRLLAGEIRVQRVEAQRDLVPVLQRVGDVVEPVPDEGAAPRRRGFVGLRRGPGSDRGDLGTGGVAGPDGRPEVRAGGVALGEEALDPLGRRAGLHEARLGGRSVRPGLIEAALQLGDARDPAILRLVAQARLEVLEVADAGSRSSDLALELVQGRRVDEGLARLGARSPSRSPGRSAVPASRSRRRAPAVAARATATRALTVAWVPAEAWRR